MEQKLDPNQATKFDHGKRMSVSPLRAKMAIDDVGTYGATKYDLGNWHRGKSFAWGRLIDAAYRHLQAFELGEDIDPESNLPHLAHAGWCIQACLELQLTHHGEDDRRIRQYFPPSAGDAVTPPREKLSIPIGGLNPPGTHQFRPPTDTQYTETAPPAEQPDAPHVAANPITTPPHNLDDEIPF